MKTIMALFPNSDRRTDFYIELGSFGNKLQCDFFLSFPEPGPVGESKLSHICR